MTVHNMLSLHTLTPIQINTETFHANTNYQYIVLIP